jgi:hypothetical protein
MFHAFMGQSHYRPMNALIKREYPNADLIWITDDPSPLNGPRTSVFRVFIDADFTIRTEKDKGSFDPSTIFTGLAVSKPHTVVNGLDYYPSYWDMDPDQRYVYLEWLMDVSQPVDMGYVFTYYYGLERHLLLGKRHLAFGEIVRLRRYHKNRSFLNYSQNAMIFTCLHHREIQPLLSLEPTDQLTGFGPVNLLLAHQLGLNLSAENVAWVCTHLDPKAKTAMKQDPELLIRCTESVLADRFGESGYPFVELHPSIDIEKVRMPAYSNYSFPRDIRFVDLPDFTRDLGYRQQMGSIFLQAHQLYKAERAAQRKERR